MADKKRTKSGNDSSQNPPVNTEPNALLDEEALDLDELDDLLDDSPVEAEDIGDFPSGNTAFGQVPEPLPPPEDFTATHEDGIESTESVNLAELMGEERGLSPFDSPTSEGGPRGVRKDVAEDALDVGAWDLPQLDETLGVAPVSETPRTFPHPAEEERARDAARAQAAHEEAERLAAAQRDEENERAREEARAEAARAEAAREAELRAAEDARAHEEEQLRAQSPMEPQADDQTGQVELEPAEEPEPVPVVAAPEPPRAPAARSRPEPPREPEGEVSADFRRESQRLARARDWKHLAELTASALDETWAQTREVRATLLADLGRIQRDRLSDPAGAEKSFAALVNLEPAHVDGFEFLTKAYESRGEWRKLYDLHLNAVEATWDAGERLQWTKRAVQVAEERLLSAELSIEAWERLEKLGDSAEATMRALADAYRATGRWDRLTAFLERAADIESGAERRLQLREVAEACLSGLRDAEHASLVIGKLLTDRPDDPVTLLVQARVEARRRNWDGLFKLGTRAPLKTNDKVDVVTTNDLRRIAADALAHGGEHDRAAEIYDLILRERPGEKEAIVAKERYLNQSGRIAELVDFLAARAEQSEGEERGRLLSRAAEIAERDLGKPARAVELWEARARLPEGRTEALRALEALHETLGDDQGLRRDLEEQLDLSPSTAQRIELLRRLGRHAAHRLHDDALAERCWTEILRAVPDDRDVRDELVALYRRRSDFAALDRALDAQGWRPADDSSVRTLWRAAAENIDENLAQDPRWSGRAGAAWRRVLDLEPGDAGALAAVVKHERGAGGDGRALISALEAQLASVASTTDKVGLGLEIASRWEALGDRAAASAAYERVLWWSPDDKTAIGHLLPLRVQTGSNANAALLDRAAATQPVGSPERRTLVRHQVELVAKDDALGRFYAWRRLYRLVGPDQDIVKQLTAAATSAGAFRELEAVLVDLAARSDGDSRRRYHHDLAALYEDRLDDPLRALLALTSARHEAVNGVGELEGALRLCETTKRFEDAYALLGVAARHDAPLPTRVDAIRKRVALAEERLDDPERAFHECERLLELEPNDAEALTAARRLAKQKQLGRALDALYAELGDRADTPAARAAITRERYELRAGELGDAPGALDQLWLLYHLMPTAETESLLLDAAGKQKEWDRVLAVVEARARAGITGDGLAPLSLVARLHETERNDPERALELSSVALASSDEGLDEAVERLAAQTNRWSWLVDSYRSAAARTTNPGRALTLYRRVADVYGDKLSQPELALDVHRRILQLDGNDLGSLEMSIAHLRTAELWRELRDALSHWVQVASSSDPDRSLLIQRQLTIAAISRDRLGDPEQALTTFAQVLSIEPGNQLALDGITSLTGGAMTPELEARRLRLELLRSQGDERTQLLLRIAALHEEKLEDRKGAITVLKELVESTGAAGPGYEPLRKLYVKDKAWRELVDLLETHAGATTGPARDHALSEALSLAETQPEAGAERKERLCRLLVQSKPDDIEARRRLLSLLREGGRYEELADRLEETLRELGDADDDDRDTREMRGLIEAELSQLLERKLGKPADAAAMLLSQIERRPERPDAVLELAQLKLRQGDVNGYLAMRQEHSKTLPPTLAAYILCHLAEAADEKLNDQNKTLDFYRAARTVDPQNPAAMDALKAVGRRAKSWRASAALLPDPDERELSWSARSARLLERARAARSTDPTQAHMWLERAIATDPDNHEAWVELATISRLRRDDVEMFAATRSAVFAFVRAAGADPERQAELAQRVLVWSDALRRSRPNLSARLAWHAYELRPMLPAAALRAASELLDKGRDEEAYSIYDRLLQNPSQLASTEKLEATFRRGALRSKLGDHESAINDFRDGLRIEELHPPLLTELAQVLAASGHVASAAVHCIQALLLSSDRARRAELYARLGRLFEGELANEDEAGVCFDRSMTSGSMDPQVMLRALGHYRRRGEIDRALKVIEGLLPSTKKPEDLAALWAERGRLIADRDPEKAIEAFDMALSYDPSCQPAVSGLAAVLEARGDWTQLLELLEVRAEQGAPSERAEALRGLARIAQGHLEDAPRAEGYLKQAIALSPKREDYEALLAAYGNDVSRRAEKRDLVAALLGMGGPVMARVVELGRELVAEGQRQWAWALLAPLMNTTLSEPTLKALVLELRKEFEKQDTLSRLQPTSHEVVRPADVPKAAFDLLLAVDALGPVGPVELEGVTLGKLDARTAVGKTFLALAERLGLANAQLFRAQELSAPFVVLDTEAPLVVLRADLVQLMAPGETNYLFTMTLENARPGTRLVTSLPPEQRAHFLPALLDVLGISQAAPGAEALVAKLSAVIPTDKRAELAALLSDTDRARLAAEGAGHRFAEALFETARRVGLIAAADLRFPAKVLTRLDETLPKMPTAGRMDDLDEFMSGATPVRALVSFAASSQFQKALEPA